jgi:hypothetical protein
MAGFFRFRFGEAELHMARLCGRERLRVNDAVL